MKVNETGRIPDSTMIQSVSLRVGDLKSALSFYCDVLGLKEIKTEGSEVRLSAGGGEPAQVILLHDRHARARNPASPGLFHTAFLLPTRKDLAFSLNVLTETRWPVDGFADHGVSEAIYLTDPEGNGIELYADRPKSLWPEKNGEIAMVTQPLDVWGLLNELSEGQNAVRGLDPSTIIGHIHLQVSDLPMAERFYHHLLGFTVTQRSYPGALFVSAGGYHHHLGLNVWNSRNNLPEKDVLGLSSFEIRVPDAGAIEAIRTRMDSKIVMSRTDDGKRIILRDFDDIAVSIVA